VFLTRFVSEIELEEQPGYDAEFIVGAAHAGALEEPPRGESHGLLCKEQFATV
jgi:hypothetical protein